MRSETNKHWAGYIVERPYEKDFVGIEGDWTVPELSGGISSVWSAWIGIGGYGTQDILQIGIARQRTGLFALYEAGAGPGDTFVKIPEIPVRIGDQIHAAIYLSNSPNRWTIAIRNKTSGDSWGKVITYDFSMKSAEWIVERPPTYLNDRPEMCNFGKATFTDCKATLGSGTRSLSELVSTESLVRAIITDDGSFSGKILAQPGPVDTSNSFVVYQGQTMPYVQYETTTVRTATATTSQTYRTQSDWTAPLATVTGATGWANIVRNGGFEDEYSEWKWGLPETRAKWGVTITQGKSHSGSRSLLVEGDGEALWQEYDMVPLKPGTHLSYFSYLERNAGYENPQSYFQLLLTRHMSDGTTMTAMIGIYMTIENKANSEEFSAGNYPVIWIRYNGNPVNSWIKTEIDVWTVFDKHFNNPDEFRIYKIITGGSQFGAYLDDISLTVPGVNIARTTWQQDVPVSDAGGSHIVSILVLGVIILSGFLALTLAMLRHKNTSKRVFL
jgi:hypothetical protein